MHWKELMGLAAQHQDSMTAVRHLPGPMKGLLVT